ncbi:Putative choice-of-anchor B domain-containing protein [Septoria linicola]|uniref:Choice-of-anchor B domain-containing protein n=1 Tax=Septoria linicola TaxID=215465 RepID=A0A9Q9EKF2_9PEZI|nr:putative choice-of-anchor B domain-containing protein [Septoria linicola]USW54000.1 Putative choice-of-anchor B domain-containing protein [Septoria linicola]
MKLQNLATAIAALATSNVLAEEAKMDRLMQLKEQTWSRARAEGVFGGSKLYKKITSFRPCINGVSGLRGEDQYKCSNVDMHGFLSHEDLGSKSMVGNDVWGWVSPSGREFGIVGQTDGVGFVEVNKLTGSLDYIGRLDTQTPNQIVSWRDMKVIDNHVYIGAESNNHGLQIFDLRKLEQVKGRLNPFWKPKVFSTTSDVKLFTGFGASHNIVADTDRKIIYAAGGRSGPNSRNTPCAGGLFIVDVKDPNNPTSPGCTGQDGYVHDAQCVVYKGPTQKYQGKNICFNFNEDTLTVMDMTNLTSPVVVSKTPYVGNQYTHQGWLANSEMTMLLLDDELDELDGVGPSAGNGRSVTYLFNIANLEKPVNTGFYQSPEGVKSIDHNLYVKDNLAYHANYGSGLRVRDVSSVSRDMTGGGVVERGFFDCHPEDDAEGGAVEFLGTWSTYPYFPSGYILLNSIERGIFSLKYTGRRAG